MSLAGRYSFAIQRGADFARAFRKSIKDSGDPVDLTGLKVRAQIRQYDNEYGTTTTSSLLLDLPNGAGVAITDAVNGEITLTLTAAQAIALCPANQKTKVSYGIEIYDDGTDPETVQPFLQGHITILPEVVR